jgi:hypothetical protein
LIAVVPDAVEKLTRDLQECGALASVIGNVREGAGIEVR